jgi:predicted HD superfamily hydrolase involved in NAD metabolism
VNLNKAYENIRNEIKLTLNNKRFEHSLNVELEAIKLAQIYDSDVEKARVAAIAHDFAKAYSDEDLLRMSQSYSFKIDEIEYNFPQLLHGPVAAYICSTKYGITDQDVLNAIRFHTTGRKSMSLLEKIIYLSDVIEPGRDFPRINDIREIALKDIDRALILACNSTLIYITNKNYLIHPLTIEFRNSLLLKGGILNEKQ